MVNLTKTKHSFELILKESLRNYYSFPFHAVITAPDRRAATQNKFSKQGLLLNKFQQKLRQVHSKPPIPTASLNVLEQNASEKYNRQPITTYESITNREQIEQKLIIFQLSKLVKK